MDIHDAKEAGRLAVAYQKYEDGLRALRDRPEAAIDVSGLRVLGEALPEDLRHGVIDAIRNHLDMRLVRRAQFAARALRDLGVEMGKYPTETDPSLGEPAAAPAMRREVADLRTTFSTGGAETVVSTYQDVRDARDIERAKQWISSPRKDRRLEGEHLMLVVKTRRARRGRPDLTGA